MKALTSLLFLLLLPTCAVQAAPQAKPDPAMFLPGVVSDDGAFGLTLSPDGQHALWVKSGGTRARLVIMEARKVNGAWQAPSVAPFSGVEGANDIDPMFSPDGRSLIFQSNRPVPDRPARKGFDIYAVERTAQGWGAVRHLGHEINTDASESSAAMAANGSIYFMKEAPGMQSDLWVSELVGGRYGAPRNLGLPVNTKARESNPYVAPDESYLIYFSAADLETRPDLFIAFREKGRWSTPKRLRAPINSNDPDDAEFTPFVHGSTLYLGRQRRTGERFIENIYAYPFDAREYR
ncbi:PD40 domain-containing protein [Massilia sp. ST3]|uniref:TolB family protein n=1 Tax=Massilia sp. ST3 TaxID=2824903 RepID=UPI001B814071|nr:PD40 domain-containing protein [Massilia sp. ST3]MBQ5948301.1 PD40 domain-containing protein [Massilia sp. ST3]